VKSTAKGRIADISCGGPYCVRTEQDNVPTGSECATGTHSIDLATGNVLAARITFPSASGAWGEPFTTRLAAHELGHLLGLDDLPTGCATSASVMRPVSCGATGGFSTAPQPSDYLPVTHSTYGEFRPLCVRRTK
jgi:hypothetical protein